MVILRQIRLYRKPEDIGWRKACKNLNDAKRKKTYESRNLVKDATTFLSGLYFDPNAINNINKMYS